MALLKQEERAEMVENLKNELLSRKGDIDGSDNNDSGICIYLYKVLHVSVCLYIRLQLGNGCDDRLRIFREIQGASGIVLGAKSCGKCHEYDS